MKQSICMALLLVFWCAFSAGAEEGLNHSGEFGLGLPRGDMDVSANGFFTLAVPTGEYWQFRTTLHETISAKKTGEHRLVMNVLAGYALARLGCNQPWKGFAPFAEIGGGLHFMISRASGDSPVNEGTELKLLSKAHGFVGGEYSFDGNKLLSLRVRFTYPSDIIVDAFYLNYGLRF